MKNIHRNKLSLSFLLLVLLISSITSCRKDDGCGGCECVRPVTTEGANTISCLINGEPWSSCAGTGNSIGGEPTDAIGFMWDNADGWNYMSITGYQFNNSNRNVLEISLDPPTVEPIHIYSKRRFRLFLDQFTKYNPGKLAEYNIDTTQPWQIDVLRFDPDSRIISGTFFASVKDYFYKPNGERDSLSLAITDGQFDIKY